MGHGHGARRGMARGAKDEPGGRPHVVEGRGAPCRQGRVGTHGWGSWMEVVAHSWVGGPWVGRGRP